MHTKLDIYVFINIGRGHLSLTIFTKDLVLSIESEGHFCKRGGGKGKEWA